MSDVSRSGLDRIRSGFELRDLRRDIAALDQFVVAANHLKLRLFPFAPEADGELVLADVRSGYVSLEAARKDYGVVIHQHGRRFALDVEATTALRQGRNQRAENLTAENANVAKSERTYP